ncbi:glycosaminoglycan attachment site [Blastochloris viridis]|nr:glycosaminoglycan attachment site [Blastochloris viridis]
MRREMESVAHQDAAEYYQGDEKGEPLDFFTPVVARERLHPNFAKVAEQEGFSSARGIIKPMMHWYEDPDGNFVEQFQTTGFDARIWELYLFAAFTEMGYQIDRAEAIPDFTCKSIGIEFCVEATTVNASREGPLSTVPQLDTDEGRIAFMREFMPLKYGSALHTKFKKKYWEKPNVKGKPLVFAIADFQGGASMIMTRSALHTYLYGYDYDWHKDEAGCLHIIPRKIEKHSWSTKEITSGFFNQPGAENISAVVFNNSGTISKFLRMGMLAGFGSPRVVLTRIGTAVDHDPNAAEPIAFKHNVNSPNYSETWVEGFDVFHNPNALHPLEEWMLPGASHHWLLPDKQMRSLTPDWHPLGSMTYISVNESAPVEAN